MLATLHDAAVRRPAATLGITLAVVVALATQAPRLHVLLSLESLAERALPSTRVNAAARAAFDAGNDLGVVLAPAHDGAALTPAQIRRFGAWAAGESDSNPDVRRVVSPFTLSQVRVVGLFPVSVPLVSSGGPDEMAALAASAWGGILTDSRGRDIAAQLDLRDTPGGSRYGRFDPAAVARIERSLRADVVQGDSLRVFLVGPAAFEYYSLQGIRRFRILNVVTLLLLLLLLRAWTGTWRGGALNAGILVVAGIGVAGSMSLAGHPIDLLSTGLFLILAVAALEDFMFLSYLRRRHRSGWQRCFRVMLVPSFLTSLTTVIGFWSLYTADLAIVRRLGLWAGVGAIVEWIVMFLVLPAFLARFPSWRGWSEPGHVRDAGLPRRLASLAAPRPLAMALLLVYIAAGYGAFHLERSDSIPRLFDRNHPYRRGMTYLEASRGYQGSVGVVIPRGAGPGAQRAVLERLAEQPGVARVVDPYGAADDAAGGFGAPYDLLDLPEAERERLRSMLAPDGAIRATVYLEHIEMPALEHTLTNLRRVSAEAGGAIAGELVTYSEFAERVPATLYRSLGACLLLVGLVMLWVLFSLRIPRKVPTLLAAFWGAALLIAVLWLARVPLTFLTCIFASVLVGLTGDNVIQYAFASRHGSLAEGIRRRGGASILVAACMALASLVFLGSAFVPSRTLGTLLALGFVASVTGDLWLLLGLLRGDARRPAATGERLSIR